jgi:uncharacterized protein YjgD (DUF1641 family)
MSNTEINTENLVKKINAIMDNLTQLIHNDLQVDKSKMLRELHDIYTTARDCRDMLTFDAVNKDVNRELSSNSVYNICGIDIDDESMDYALELISNHSKLTPTISFIQYKYNLDIKTAKEVVNIIRYRYMVGA